MSIFDTINNAVSNATQNSVGALPISSPAPQAKAPEVSTPATSITGNGVGPLAPTPVINSNPKGKSDAQNIVNTQDKAIADAKTASDLKAQNDAQAKIVSDKATADKAAADKAAIDAIHATPDSSIMNTPTAGNQFGFDANSTRSEYDANSPLPTGITSQPGKTRTDVTDSTSDSTGNIIKQFADGTYGRFNLATNSYVPTDSGTFNMAKNNATLQKMQTDALNGTYNENQKSQLSALTAKWDSLIQGLQTDANNSAGAINAAARGYGFLDSAGIANSYKVNLQNIIDATAKQNEGIATMKQSFLDNDSKLLAQGYADYRASNTAIEKNIDQARTEAEKLQAKLTDANINENVSAAKKYDTAGILPSDTAEQRIAKLKNDPRATQDNAVKATLAPEQNAWYADFTSTGAGKYLSLPGRGIKSNDINIPIIQSIISKAISAGLTGDEFGAALKNKDSAGKALDKITFQGARLATDEQKVVEDIKGTSSGKFQDGLEYLAGQVDSKEFQTNLPLLQRYLQGIDTNVKGSQAYINYAGLLKTTLTAYARVVNSQTGTAGTSVSINDEIQNILPKGASPKNAVDYMNQVAIPEMKHTTNSFASTSDSLKETIGAAIGGNVKSNLSTSSSASTVAGTTVTSKSGKSYNLPNNIH
jgi:hypothetical protein